MVERILVGTDGSEVAGHAVSAAIRLAQATEAQLRFLHAIELPALYASGPEMDPRLTEEREQAGRRVLDNARDRAASRDIHTSTVMRDGSPGRALLEEAENWDADLVAAGSHGRGGLQRAVLGSVTDMLVRNAPLPVLTTRRAWKEPSVPLDRIVLPSDGSELAARAVPLAIELATATGAEVDLLYAVPPEVEESARLDDSVDLQEAEAHLAHEALAPLEEECRSAGVECRRVVRHDPPHRAIAGHAEDAETDLIVMATRGHGGIRRFLMGSVAEKVLRTAGPPLVTVQPNAVGER